jgi:DnaJ-class molecular chaperone
MGADDDDREDDEVLGISADATKDEIIAAHKELSLKHHPDKGGNAEEFKRITAAKENMLDKLKQSKEAREMADMNANEDEDTLGKTVDTSAALEKIRQQQAERQKAEKAKADALGAIPVKEEDVDLIVQEMEVDKARAKRVLQENDGDVERALNFLVTNFPELYPVVDAPQLTA